MVDVSILFQFYYYRKRNMEIQAKISAMNKANVALGKGKNNANTTVTTDRSGASLASVEMDYFG